MLTISPFFTLLENVELVENYKGVYSILNTVFIQAFGTKEKWAQTILGIKLPLISLQFDKLIVPGWICYLHLHPSLAAVLVL